MKNGLVYAWGNNNQGQVGDGTQTQRLSPTLISGLSDITDVAAGIYSSYALDINGNLWSWGYNVNGQLGLGDTTDRLTPQQVLAPVGYKFASIDSDGDALHVFATVVALVVPEPGTLSLLALSG